MLQNTCKKNVHTSIYLRQQKPRNNSAAAAKSLQSCLTLCDPIDGSPSGSAVPGILQARTMEWRNNPSVCQNYVKSEVTQSCPILCNPMDCSLPGSLVHGILQSTRVGCYFLLQGIFPTQGSNPGLLHCRQMHYHLSHSIKNTKNK